MSGPGKFRKLPVEVEAVQFTGTNDPVYDPVLKQRRAWRHAKRKQRAA